MTTSEVLFFLTKITLPATLSIRVGEEITDLPLYISTNMARMYCGVPILEVQARSRMMRLALRLQDDGLVKL